VDAAPAGDPDHDGDGHESCARQVISTWPTRPIELLRETLRRFQERIDVDSIIPPVERGEDGKPVAEAQAMQQAQQLGLQVQELQQQLTACQAELQKAQQGDASKAAAAQANAAVKQTESDNAKALKEADIASRERLANFEAEQRRLLEEQKSKDAAEARAAEATAKADVERHLALVKGAVDLLSKQMDNAAEAAQAGLTTEAAAQSGADAAAQMQTIVGGVNETMAALTKAMEGLAAAHSAPREIVLGNDGMPAEIRTKVATV
jgi:DNA repair exonuclease SbcCD ATPase subunit